jgi:hypothetical protein
VIQFEIPSKVGYQLKKIIISKPFLNSNFEIGGGAVLLLWANTFSPLA